MKIRTDFVTNSSSSSFVSIHVSGGKLMEIMNRYKDAFEALSTSNEKKRDEYYQRRKSGETISPMSTDTNIWARVPEFSDNAFDFEITEKIKTPKTKEDVFDLLLTMANSFASNEFTDIVSEFEQNKQPIMDTLDAFDCTEFGLFYGDSICDVIDYIEDAAYEHLGVCEGAQFDKFCSDAAACNCELRRLYKLDGESVKLVKEEFEIVG